MSIGAGQVGSSVKGAIMATQPILLDEQPADWPDWPDETARRLVALLGAAQRLAECRFHEHGELEARLTFEAAIERTETAQLSASDLEAILTVTGEIAAGQTRHNFETCSRCQLIVLESYVFSRRHDTDVIKIPRELLREALDRVQ
jgi:hypothetical protein